MSFELALRATEILLGLTFIQQSAEHLANRSDRRLFLPRLLLSVLLVLGVQPALVCLGLSGLTLLILHRFQGPYNGGSDRMGILILTALTLAHLLPSQSLKELAIGYLAMQLILSYFISGWVKLINPDWRKGRALAEVFQFSAYPVSEDLRSMAKRKTLLLMGSWGVIALEILFPFAMLTQSSLIAALILAACFHLANGCLFGLNRFVWTWIAAYPSLLWLQERLMLGVIWGA